MKRTGNWAFAASLLTIFSLLLTACGGENTATVPPPTTAPAPTTAAAPTDTAMVAAPTAMTGETPTAMTSMPAFDPSKVKKMDVEAGATLRLSGWSSTPAELKIVSDTLGMFKQVYPDITVNYEPVPDNFDTKIRAMVQGGTEPDVFYISPPVADELMDADKLLELTPYLTAAGSGKSAYFDAMINIFSRGDKVYGLPKDFGAIADFYNTDMLAKTGTAAPKDGWTWDDYKAFAKSMTQGTDPNTKVFGVIHPPDYARWLNFALANGGSVLSADGKKAAINSKEVVDALNWYHSLIDDGTAGTAKDVGAGWPGEAFGKGRTASAIEGGWMIPYLADPKNGFSVKYDVAPLPAGPGGKQGGLIFTNAYGASAATKSPKAAAALVMFLAGPEVQGMVLHTGFALPTLKSFSSDPYFQSSDVVAKANRVIYAVGSYGVPDYYGPKNGKIQDALGKATDRFYQKQQTAQEALDQAAQEINDVLSAP